MQLLQSQSTYDNPQLYPQIFPWLFPYGLGGIGNEHGFKKVSDKARKKSLLMYHDKRFQLEPMFPLVAINHEQIKGSTTGGYLLAKKSTSQQFQSACLKLNRSVMSDLLERLSSGESVSQSLIWRKSAFRLSMIWIMLHTMCRDPEQTGNTCAMRSGPWLHSLVLPHGLSHSLLQI